MDFTEKEIETKYNNLQKSLTYFQNKLEMIEFDAKYIDDYYIKLLERVHTLAVYYDDGTNTNEKYNEICQIQKNIMYKYRQFCKNNGLL